MTEFLCQLKIGIATRALITRELNVCNYVYARLAGISAPGATCSPRLAAPEA
jgi:hypothetical protein